METNCSSGFVVCPSVLRNHLRTTTVRLNLPAVVSQVVDIPATLVTLILTHYLELRGGKTRACLTAAHPAKSLRTLIAKSNPATHSEDLESRLPFAILAFSHGRVSLLPLTNYTAHNHVPDVSSPI